MAPQSDGFAQFYRSQVIDLAGSIGLRIKLGEKRRGEEVDVRVVGEALPSRTLLRLARNEQVPNTLLIDRGYCDIAKRRSLLSEDWGIFADAVADEFVCDTLAECFGFGALRMSRAIICTDAAARPLTVISPVAVRYEIPLSFSGKVDRKSDRDGPHHDLTTTILSAKYGQVAPVPWQWNVGWLWKPQSGDALEQPRSTAERRFICIEYEEKAS